MNRKKLVLFILVILLGLSLVYGYFRTPRQQTVAKLKYSQGAVASPDEQRKASTQPRSAKQTVSPVQGDSAVRLALLEPDIEGFSGFRRNIFKPIFREELKVVPLPPPPPAPPKKVEPVKDKKVPATDAPPAPTARQEAEKRIGKLRFLGFYKNDANKTIFLAEGPEIFLVKKGDKISGRYEVTRLTDEAITISVLSDGSDLVFPLVENRSLTLGKQ